MGSGVWSKAVYAKTKKFQQVNGISAFQYTDAGATKVHELLDPKGVKVRESRDSAEHPESLAIAVLFDVTGSMRDVPRLLEKKLPDLFGLLTRGGYVEHPQIMFGAIGDARSDAAPLQVGQFESDNRVANDLGNIYLEGGGGGQQMETYELAAYFMARHTSIDCAEKRGHKGYLFIIGDEKPYPAVSIADIERVLGDKVKADVPTADIFKELEEKYNVYLIQPGEGSSYVGDADLVSTWKRLVGKNYIQLDKPDQVAHVIALTVAINEGLDFEKGIDELKALDASAAKSIQKALIGMAPVNVAVVAGGLPADLNSDPKKVATTA